MTRFVLICVHLSATCLPSPQRLCLYSLPGVKYKLAGTKVRASYSLTVDSPFGQCGQAASEMQRADLSQVYIVSRNGWIGDLRVDEMLKRRCYSFA